MDQPSLFAEKLRSWRSQAGVHGRVTQEALAELLGVSVDAIGKYERSVSFIRGDLEHRLGEALGWSRAEILACRENWELRQRNGPDLRYRLLDQAVVDEVFDGSWRGAIVAGLQLADGEFAGLHQAFLPTHETFVPMYEAAHDHWAMVMQGNQIVAKWAVAFLLPDDEVAFREGRYLESDMTVDRLRRPILPGQYFAYCPALIVSPGHEAAASMLVSSFVSFLEGLADRDVFLGGLGTVAVSGAGAQLCRDIGMEPLGPHAVDPRYSVWVLPGQGIAGSVFGRRNGRLARRYEAAFAD